MEDGGASEPISDFRIMADNFYVFHPSFPDRAVFGVETRNGVIGIKLRADMISDNSINAPQINVDAISSISANIGEITAGDLNFGGVKILGAAQRIEIYDAT